MATPPIPTVLFVQNNQIYFEFDTVTCIGATSFQAGYLNNDLPVFAREDEASRKGTVYRFVFDTAPLTLYSIFSRAIYRTAVKNSDYKIQLSNGRDAPQPLVFISEYKDSEQCIVKTVVTIPDSVGQLKVFWKATTDLFYDSKVVPFAVGQTKEIVIGGLMPLTNYQIFLQTINDEGITNGPTSIIRTQAVGCPVGQPVTGKDGGLPFVYPEIRIPPPGNPNGRISLSIYSNFINVTGDNLVFTGALVLPNGQIIESVVNSQNDDARISCHTFNGLLPNTNYTLFSIVRNPIGMQRSTNGERVLTPVFPVPADVPLPGRTLTYDTGNGYGIVVDTLSNVLFNPPNRPQNITKPRFDLVIQTALTPDFPPDAIIEYLWTRIPPNNFITSNNTLPFVRTYIRSVLFDFEENTLQYSNVFIYDGLASKKP